MLVVFVGLVHFHDGWVVAFPQDGDLINESLLILDVLFLDDLDGPNSVGVLFGLRLVHSTVSAFSQNLLA